MTTSTYTLGLLGARGYVGAELIALLAGHPRLRLRHAASREPGRALREHTPTAPADVVLEALGPEVAAGWRVDAVVLALPNGHASDYASALSADTVVVDLSADHRFVAAWAYGLPELRRARLAGARRISNPGCYATGIQLGIAPALSVLAGPPQVFGVSGYSGAGTTPSPRNDPQRLHDNLLPYALIGHLHEREAATHLDHPLHFTPHVASFFRGISLTIALPLRRDETAAGLLARYRDAYAEEPLVRVVEDIPEVAQAAGRHGVTIGGFAVSQRRAVLVVTLDNLLKGAATQALQNLNLALGLPERMGIPDDDATTLG